MLKAIKWEIESSCNLNCKHCFVGKTKYSKSNSLEKNKQIVDKLVNLGLKQIIFSSKEPFKYKDFIHLIKYCRNKQLDISIVTNGTLLTEEFIKILLTCNIKFLSISLEGINAKSNDFIRGNGVFDTVMNNISLIQKLEKESKRSLPLALQLTLNKNTIDEIDELINYFKDNKFTTINIGDIALTGNARDNLDIKLSDDKYNYIINHLLYNYSLLENKSFSLNFKKCTPHEIIYFNTIYNLNLDIPIPQCPVNGNTFSLLPDGTMCSCVALLEEFPDVDICSGHILDESIKFKSDVKLEMIQNYKNDGICMKCKFNNKCLACLVMCADKKEINNMKSSCNKYYNELNILVEKIFNGNINFKFRNELFLMLNKDDALIMKKFYYTSNENIIEIKSKDYIELILELYKSDEYVNIRDFNYNKFSKELLTEFVFNDFLSIKNKC